MDLPKSVWHSSIKAWFLKKWYQRTFLKCNNICKLTIRSSDPPKSKYYQNLFYIIHIIWEIFVDQCKANLKVKGSQNLNTISQIIGYINLKPKDFYYLRSKHAEFELLKEENEEEIMIIKEIRSKLEHNNMLFKSEKNKFFKAKKKFQLWEMINSIYTTSQQMIVSVNNTNEVPFNSNHRGKVFKIYFEEQLFESNEYSENYQDILNSYFDVNKEVKDYIQNFLLKSSKMVNRKTDKTLKMYQLQISKETQKFIIKMHNDSLVNMLANLMRKILEKSIEKSDFEFELQESEAEEISRIEAYDGEIFKMKDYDSARVANFLKEVCSIARNLKMLMQNYSCEAFGSCIESVSQMQADELDLGAYFELILKKLDMLGYQSECVEYLQKNNLLSRIVN